LSRILFASSPDRARGLVQRIDFPASAAVEMTSSWRKLGRATTMVSTSG
jgi:hypothetical protein